MNILSLRIWLCLLHIAFYVFAFGFAVSVLALVFSTLLPIGGFHA